MYLCLGMEAPSREPTSFGRNQRELIMSLIPWRKQSEGLATLESTFDDFWKQDFWKNLFESSNGPRNRLPALFENRTFPAMNVAESETEYLVSLELAGMDSKDIHIEVMGNQLNITGERKWEEEKKEKEFHRMESQLGSFSRSLTLPGNACLERESIEATFQKGMLEIKIPKIEPTPATKIAIKVK